MKRFRISRIIMMTAVLVCFLWATGCAKKAVQGDVSSSAQTAAQTSAGEVKEAPEVKPEPVAKAEPEPAQGGDAKETAAAPAATTKSAEIEDIHFDYDKSVLRPEDREILKRHADWLKQNKNATVVIEGNCDERGTTEYNLALGERRANEAMNYLVGLGIEKERIKTISYGEERPLDPGHNEEAWAKNRRDHFVITIQ